MMALSHEAPQTERLVDTENWTFLGWDSAQF